MRKLMILLATVAVALSLAPVAVAVYPDGGSCTAYPHYCWTEASGWYVCGYFCA